MQTLVYALLVHVVSAGFVACCLCSGMALMGPIRWRGWAESVLEIATRIGLGIVAGSTIVVVLGLFHALSASVAWGCFGLLILAGTLRSGWCEWRLAPVQGLLRIWRDCSLGMRVAAVAVGVCLALLCLNILVGALAPDVQRDSLWYHLTMPGQWIIRGDVAMLPHCMPSTYTVGVEALYVLLLPLRDTLFITAFVSHIHLLTMAVFLAIAWHHGGMAGALLAAGLIPFAYASSFAYAPIPAKPDPVTIFLLGLGWWRLARMLDEPSAVRASELAVAGAICGGAVAAKLSSLLLLLPLGVCFVVAIAAQQRNWRTVLSVVVWPSLLALVVLLPWFVRAAMYSGNPVIHVARGIFPINPEFLPALRGYDRVPMFHPLTVEGLREAVFESLPFRLFVAAASLNILFYIIPVASVVAIGSRLRSARITGVGFVIAYAVWVPLLYGKGEELRYFGVGALAAAPALAGFCEIIARRRGPGWIAVMAMCLLLATGANYARQQLHFAVLPTVNWRFRPVVITQDRLQWLEPTADGLRSHYYQLLDKALPSDAFVLLPDSPGPFYLKRKAAWCDYFTCPLLDDWWPGFDGFAAHADLQARGITHIVTEHKVIDHRIRTMAEDGLIIPMPIDDLPPNWRVWFIGVP